jgi:hypothetical protein
MDISHFFLTLAKKWDDPGQWGIPCLNHQPESQAMRQRHQKTALVRMRDVAVPVAALPRSCGTPFEYMAHDREGLKSSVLEIMLEHKDGLGRKPFDVSYP